jgi:uncharacterized protein YjbJ (UPF0337 family)
MGDFHRKHTQITGSQEYRPALYLHIDNRFRRQTMNTDQLQGKWKQMKGTVKERWGKLTDDDIDVINGRSDQLVGKVQEKYGIAKEEAQRQVDEWMRSDTQTQRDDFEKRRAS